MEKHAAFIFILLVTCSLQTIAQPLATTVVGELDSGLGNTSALFYWENRLWTSNDHGNLTLHCLDTLTAATLQQVGCDTSFNDMEEVAQDSVYFYFGDFGNNHERLRNDLRILRMRKSDLTRGLCRFDTIAFTYSGYDPAGAGARRLPTTDYDCEAMVAVGDSLFLFTKQWSSRHTTCFALPKEPGTYTALPRFTLDVDGLVTGACHTARITPEGTRQVLALCGYSLLLQPFVFVMYDFDGTAFDQGHHDRLALDRPIGTQTEAIVSADGLHYWLTNEAFSRFGISQPAQLLSIDLSTLLGDYLRPDSSHAAVPSLTGEMEEEPAVYPNPTDGTLTIDLPDAEKLEVLDSTGRLLLHSDASHTLDLRDLESGTYLLRITTRQGNVVSHKVVKQ